MAVSRDKRYAGDALKLRVLRPQRMGRSDTVTLRKRHHSDDDLALLPPPSNSQLDRSVRTPLSLSDGSFHAHELNYSVRTFS
jgi:hypothetical protein